MKNLIEYFSNLFKQDKFEQETRGNIKAPVTMYNHKNHPVGGLYVDISSEFKDYSQNPLIKLVATPKSKGK